LFGTANPVSQLINDVIAFLPRILVAIVLIIVAAAIAKVARDMVTGVRHGASGGQPLGAVAYWLIMSFARLTEAVRCPAADGSPAETSGMWDMPRLTVVGECRRSEACWER
jgi:hypothetical protein